MGFCYLHLTLTPKFAKVILDSKIEQKVKIMRLFMKNLHVNFTSQYFTMKVIFSLIRSHLFHHILFSIQYVVKICDLPRGLLCIMIESIENKQTFFDELINLEVADFLVQKA